ncbi:hypothetical protein DUI87_30693 [Hirundo rustica rustica]|uniref:ribonuclease H n=1 Tax=Hirundo rustica rustica TaxID=333673 RepID=A0A3M0J1X0_HIRRU|nr:hypothetical protein DUI87_30693 [Hirundo rustica rustica]
MMAAAAVVEASSASSSSTDTSSTGEERRMWRLFQTCNGNGDGFINKSPVIAGQHPGNKKGLNNKKEEEEQFWGLVHGIWPHLKRDQRRDSRSPFGPLGQLAKREQPGTGNEEERQRIKGLRARKKGIGGVGFVNAPLTASEVRGFKKELGNLVEDPIETNLLGRDLQVQLGVGVIPKDGKMVVHIMKLTQGDIQEINPEVWATEGKYGCLDIPPIKREMQKDTPAIRVKQYPMSPEGKKGLASVIEHLLKENIPEPCMSPHNTPILAIKKDEGKFRLVQDLREINKRTIAGHPVVPNPYTLLSKIPREHTWFTVIDLKDAFWACPLAEECRDWFAFEWEHPDRGRKQQLRWTRLPQGYTESPNIFGQALETLLEQFSPKEGVQILQYVDDLLISGETEKKLKMNDLLMVCRQLNMEVSVAEIMHQLGADEDGKISFQDFSQCCMELVQEIKKEEVELSVKLDDSCKKKKLRDRVTSWPTSNNNSLGRSERQGGTQYQTTDQRALQVIKEDSDSKNYQCSWAGYTIQSGICQVN